MYPGYNYEFKGFLQFDTLIEFEDWACNKAYETQWPHIHPDSNYTLDSNGIPVRRGTATSSEKRVLCLVDNVVECEYDERDLLSKTTVINRGFF